MTFLKFNRTTIVWLTAFLAICLLTVYFRTLWTQGPQPHSVRDMAKALVLGQIREQIRTRLSVTDPNLSKQEIDKILNQSAQEAARSDPENFELAIQRAESQLTGIDSSGTSHTPFLLEADPYYYYYAVKQLKETGSTSTKFKNGLFFNPFRLAPDGAWDWKSLHPHIGYYFFCLLQVFNKNQNLIIALSWVPVLLSVVVAGVFFILSRILNFSVFTTLLSSFALMMAPIFLQRSAFGWFDTDPYNYLFPILVLITFFLSLKCEKIKRVFLGACGGFLTGLYALFWAGWPFLFVLMIVIVGAVVILEFLKGEPLNRALGAAYLPIYLVSSIVFLFIFISPKSTIDVVYNGLVFLPKFSVSKFESWPSAFLTVGEAKSISIEKLSFLTGNYGISALAVIGLIAPGIYFKRHRDHLRFYEWLSIALIAIPLCVLSLKTERFAVLFVLPVALLTGFSIDWVMRVFSPFCADWVGKLSGKIWKVGFALILLATVFPLSLVQANLIARRVSPIMDLVWYQGLTAIRDTTPKDSIVFSWWPPGYFIISVAERKTIVDGGTQDRPQSFWLAKAFATADERQAAGILRMLGTSANEAMDWLQKRGLDLADSSNLILKIVSLSKSEALQVLPAQWSDIEKAELVKLTHGDRLAPGYVMMYRDLIDQNVAVTLMSQWDFEKAKAIELMQSNRKKSEKAESYIQKMLQVTGGILKYWPEALLDRRDGDFLYFQNGVQVNMKTKEVEIHAPDKHLDGNPRSLFYMQNGILTEAEIPNASIDISVLLIDHQNTFSCVVADRKLIRSMMFRWYYLDGAGLSLFKSVIKEQDPRFNNKLSVFQIDWNAVLAGE